MVLVIRVPGGCSRSVCYLFKGAFLRVFYGLFFFRSLDRTSGGFWGC